MGRGVADAKLRVWAPQGSQLLFVRQVAPTIEELSDRAVQVSELVREYPTGSWGDESRDYHVAVKVPPKALGAEQLVARVQLVVDDAVVAQGLVRATWSDDSTLTTTDQSGGGALHRPGRARVGDPGGTRRQGGRRRRDRDDQARSGRAARGRDRQRRGHEQAAAGGRDHRRGHRHRASSSARSRSSTRWRSTRARPRRRGCADERDLPAGSPVEHRRLLRRVRGADRCRRRLRAVRVGDAARGPVVVAHPRPTGRRRGAGVSELRRRATRPTRPSARRAATTSPPASSRRAVTPMPDPGADWVAEIWIDPDWFAFQNRPGGCATSGAPTVVPLRGTTAHRRPTVEEPQPESRHRLRRTTAPCRTGTRS